MSPCVARFVQFVSDRLRPHAHGPGAALEREIPEPHRAFIAGIEAKYAVPKPSGPGMRTRFIRSEEIQDAQIAAVGNSPHVYTARHHSGTDVRAHRCAHIDAQISAVGNNSRIYTAQHRSDTDARP